MCMPRCMCPGVQKRALDPVELALLAVVTHCMWVLRTKLRSWESIELSSIPESQQLLVNIITEKFCSFFPLLHFLFMCVHAAYVWLCAIGMYMWR